MALTTVNYNDSKPNSKDQAQFEFLGMVPMLYYTFEVANVGTTILMDEGSNASLITTKLANALHLKGEPRPTKVTKACDKVGETELRIHHEVELTDRMGGKHKVHCVEVNFITNPQPQPDYTKVHQLFPRLPKGCLDRPNTQVGILLGQNINQLLPTGGSGINRVGNLRVRRTILGKYGFTLEGCLPAPQKKEQKSKLLPLQTKVNYLSVTTMTKTKEFPDYLGLNQSQHSTHLDYMGLNQSQDKSQSMETKYPAPEVTNKQTDEPVLLSEDICAQHQT